MKAALIRTFLIIFSLVIVSAGFFLVFSRFSIFKDKDNVIFHATSDDFNKGTLINSEIANEGFIKIPGVNDAGIIRPVRTNILVNPSFEAGTNYMTQIGKGWSAGAYEASNEVVLVYEPFDGLRAQKIFFTPDIYGNNSYAYLTQNVSSGFTEGKTYTFSAYEKRGEVGLSEARLKMTFMKGAVKISEHNSIVSQSDSYARLSVTAKAPEGTTSIKVSLIVSSVIPGEACDCYVDAFQLEQSEEATAFRADSISGEYISPVIRAGGLGDLYKLSWTCKADIENNENIAFQIRSANTAEGIDTAEWKGPDNGLDSYTYITKSGEMLADPGVEAGSGESPANVKDRYYGSAKPVFTYIIDAADKNAAYEDGSLYVSDAYEGSRSLKVEYPEWEQGSSARWEVVYDGGVLPDRDYLFSVWHKESGGIGSLNLFVGIEYADGRTDWDYVHKAVQSSDQWKMDMIRFHTPLESDIKTVRLGISLKSGGYLITDAYSLKELTFCREWGVDGIHGGAEYIQYKTVLTASGTSVPSISDVTLCFGASKPETGWLNVYDSKTGKICYAFEGGNKAVFRIEALDFKGAGNIERASIKIRDGDGKIILKENDMTPEGTPDDVKKLFLYEYTFPDVIAGNGDEMLKAEIEIINKEGIYCLDNIYIKLKDKSMTAQKPLVIGIMATDNGFRNYRSYMENVELYKQYKGADIWKLTLNWGLLEPEHNLFNYDFISSVIGFMDEAALNGVRVQLCLSQSSWPEWPSNGYSCNMDMYSYDTAGRLAETWRDFVSYTVEGRDIKTHPALDSYLLISEDIAVYDAGIFLRWQSRITSAIREADPDLSHRIAIRPHVADTGLRTAIALGGNHDVDYGTGIYPTNSYWGFDTYASPVSETSYLKMARLRIFTGGAFGRVAGGAAVGEIGFIKSENDGFGDEERLTAFKRAMTIAYDQGMSEFMIWGSLAGFTKPLDYFPELVRYRDEITQNRPATAKDGGEWHFNVRVLIDNSEWLYREPSPAASTLNMSEQPYLSLVKTLDEGGYSWFYVHENAAQLLGQGQVTFDKTLLLSGAKWRNEEEIAVMLEGVIPGGKPLPWP